MRKKLVCLLAIIFSLAFLGCATQPTRSDQAIEKSTDLVYLNPDGSIASDNGGKIRMGSVTDDFFEEKKESADTEEFFSENARSVVSDNPAIYHSVPEVAIVARPVVKENFFDIEEEQKEIEESIKKDMEQMSLEINEQMRNFGVRYEPAKQPEETEDRLSLLEDMVWQLGLRGEVIDFPNGEDYLTEESEKKLLSIIRRGGIVFEINGHASKERGNGGEKANIQHSAERVKSIYSFLSANNAKFSPDIKNSGLKARGETSRFSYHETGNTKATVIYKLP